MKKPSFLDHPLIVVPLLIYLGYMGYEAIKYLSDNKSYKEISWTDLSGTLLPAGQVETLNVAKDRADIVMRVQQALGLDTTAPSSSGEEDDHQSGGIQNAGPGLFFTVGSDADLDRKLDIRQAELGIDRAHFVPVTYSSKMHPFADMFSAVFPLIVIGSVLFILSRSVGGATKGMFNFGKSRASMITKDTMVKVNFKDVAGLDEAKVEVMEFVSFLKNPAKYKQLGARIPKGALLQGPPGCGKTLLAKATAGEAGVPFFSVSGSDFIEMFVGVGPSRVRDLFKEARKNAPCIVFIDEIDAVGRAREPSGSSNEERDNTLNQLLVEMDGFTPSSGVVVFAGTNRADVLDKALLRPGRFDRQVSIDPPDIKGRNQIFLVHLANLRLKEKSEKISRHLSTLTPGFSGADIANVCNEAALIAARGSKENVEKEDFEAAIERIIGGLERKNRILSLEEKTRVAYHEAGHAVVGWFLEHASPLLKVSIVPRGAATLGYAQLQVRDQYLYSTGQLEDQMCMALGGRIAESLTFGTVSTGAQDDLEKVTQSAYAQTSVYGMNKAIGPLSFGRGEEEAVPLYSQRTSTIIDNEARKLVNAAFDRTKILLEGKSAELELVAQTLLKREVITRADMEALLGKRPFKQVTTYEELTEGYHDEKEAST
eukprot:TRINITY_DN498_c0_g2_i1.p1 TRINITY_DN498_c0_g2~~TRINITY_DN498_c0_g2_i1.p1  ORF type:complete len:655 (+),score=162.02 TRINITY_DN498_c0_g2_i1:2-1966(+)